MSLRAIPVHILLRQHGTEPRFERSTAHVVVEFGDPMPGTIGHPVKIGIESIGDLTASGFILGDAVGGLIERHAKPGQELLPRKLIAFRTRPR